MRLWLAVLLVGMGADCTSDADALTGPAFVPVSLSVIPQVPPATVWRSTCGTVTATGLWTAPLTPGTCTITARRTWATADTLWSATFSVVTPPPSVGTFAAGFWDYPSTLCNTMGVTGAARGITPPQVLGVLATAKRCGVQLVLVPNRAMITTTGTTKAPFSIDSAKKATDAFAAVLTPSVLATYDATLIGLNLADDYGSLDQWGGTTVSPNQIQSWAIYTKQKMPTLRLGVRVEATWVTTALASSIDYAWAQYHTGKGPVVTYFDKQRDKAQSLGIALVTGLNSTHCDGPVARICSPDEVRTYMGEAVRRPESCGAFAWDYDPQQMAVPGMTEAWTWVMGLAAQRGGKPCKHL